MCNLSIECVSYRVIFHQATLRFSPFTDTNITNSDDNDNHDDNLY